MAQIAERKQRSAPSKAKSERIELRTSPEVKELITRAAEITGRTVSEFINNHMQDIALKTVDLARRSQLTKDDLEYIVEYLKQHPAQPNEKLRALLEGNSDIYGDKESRALRSKPRSVII